MTQQPTPSLTGLHQLACEQQSRLNFLAVESMIIKTLIEDHCDLASPQATMYLLQRLCGQLSQLNILKANITRDFTSYHDHLNSTINGSVIKSTDVLAAESDRIQFEISDIDKSLKRLKKQLLIFRKNVLHQMDACLK
ncbi:hypothetical protein ACFGVR_12720 [Mucilaginibacter sp. AW1-3]